MLIEISNYKYQIMITINNRRDLEQALKRKESHIIIVGSLADEILEKAKSKQKKKKVAKVASAAAIVGGIVAAPFTAGTSLAATAAGLTVGTLTITAAELAIIIGGAVAICGLLKGYNIKIFPDGHVELVK